MFSTLLEAVYRSFNLSPRLSSRNVAQTDCGTFPAPPFSFRRVIFPCAVSLEGAPLRLLVLVPIPCPRRESEMVRRWYSLFQSCSSRTLKALNEVDQIPKSRLLYALAHFGGLGILSR